MSRESDRRPQAWQQVRSRRRAIVQGRRAYHLPPRALHGAVVRLERRAVKVACCVLRGLGEGDLAWLPGGHTGPKGVHCRKARSSGKEEPMGEDTTHFTDVDRTRDPQFFTRFLDEGNKLPAIIASKPIILEGLRLC